MKSIKTSSKQVDDADRKEMTTNKSAHQKVFEEIDRFTREIDNPSDPRFIPVSYLQRSKAFLALERYEEALEDALVVIEVKPDHWTVSDGK